MTITHTYSDFNGDGRSDVFLYQPGTTNVTDWLSNSNGSFSPTGDAWSQFGFGVGVQWINDFNGDGKADVIAVGGTAELDVWLSNGNGTFTKSFATGATSGWRIVGSADFNGDGISDVLFRNDGGYLTEWLGTASGTLVPNETNAGNGSADTSWFVEGVGDFNGDGKSDILWRNSNGYVTEWLGTANGGFVSNETHAGTGIADNSWDIQGTGDFNGDGIADILWRNTSTGYVTEWLGTSTGGFVSNQAHAGTGMADTSWQVAQLGDFNGDGRTDILWRNVNTGYVTEWLANTDGSFSSNQDIAGVNLDPSWHTIRFI